MGEYSYLDRYNTVQGETMYFSTNCIGRNITSGWEFTVGITLVPEEERKSGEKEDMVKEIEVSVYILGCLCLEGKMKYRYKVVRSDYGTIVQGPCIWRAMNSCWHILFLANSICI